jgi:predicted PurR-regulated permease PerM
VSATAPAAPRRLTLDRAAGFTWRALVVLAGVAVLVWLLLRLRIVLVPLLLALMVSTILYPVVRWERAHGAPRGLAALGGLVLGLAAIGGVLALVIPAFAHQAGDMKDAVTAAVDDIERWLRTGPLGLSEQQVEDLRGGHDDRFGGLVKTGVSTGVPIVVQVVSQALLTVFFTFFVLKDGDRIWAWILHRAGPTRRASVDAMGREAMDALAGYVRGTALVATVDAVFIGLGFWFLGVPLVLPIALLTFFTAFIPIVGSVVAGAVGVLIALADGGVTKAAIALGIVLLVQQIEGNVIQPVAVGRQVRLHPIVTIAAVAVGGTLGGIVGAALAVPIVAIVWRAIEQLRQADVALRQEAILAAEPPVAAEPAPGSGPGEPQAAQAGVVVRAR